MEFENFVEQKNGISLAVVSFIQYTELKVSKFKFIVLRALRANKQTVFQISGSYRVCLLNEGIWFKEQYRPKPVAS